MEQAQKVEDLVNFQPITRCACWNTYNCVWWGSFQLLKRQLELKDVGFCWGGGKDCSCCCCVYGWKYRVDKVKVRSSLTIPPTCVSSFNSTTLCSPWLSGSHPSSQVAKVLWFWMLLRCQPSTMKHPTSWEVAWLVWTSSVSPRTPHPDEQV